MRLRDLREDRDLSQHAVAELLHIRQNTYSQYALKIPACKSPALHLESGAFACSVTLRPRWAR